MTCWQQGQALVVSDQETIDQAQASGRWIRYTAAGKRGNHGP